MPSHTPELRPLADRGPLRTLFLLTSMPVGGAETLLVNLVRRFDRARVQAEVACLKERGPLGELLAEEMPVHANLLAGKYDFRVVGRLARLLRARRIDAVVTVGAGDKMFWGRLAARLAKLPVVLSALHSTGWPDGVGRLNRLLTPITDGFIGVAKSHGEFLVNFERFPQEKVFVIPNGIDTERFRPRPQDRARLRAELQISAEAPVCGIVAALRPEKNHELFLQAAAAVRRSLPTAEFLIIGDGPRRADLEALAESLGLTGAAHFLGTRGDIPELLAACDLFALTSHNEANPVSILEALAVELPVVATRVGSVAESVKPGETGWLIDPGSVEQAAEQWRSLLADRELAKRFGAAGRRHVLAHGSLESMVEGYTHLLEEIYDRKAKARAARRAAAPPRENISQG